MKTHKNVFQTKEEYKTTKTDFNKTELSNSSERQFKIMVIKMLIVIRRTIYEQSENVNKKTESIKSNKQK